MTSAIRSLPARCAPPATAFACICTIATLVAACGSSPAAPSTTPPASARATPAGAAPDHCVIGTWKSTGVSGSVSYADVGGASSVALSGGAGDVMVIHPDGSFSVDYGGETPWQGNGSDGASYVITTTGRLDGRVTTSGGQLTQLLTDSGSMHIGVTRNGAVFRGGSLSGPQVFGYTCTAGKTLNLNQGGTSVAWVPG